MKEIFVIEETNIENTGIISFDHSIESERQVNADESIGNELIEREIDQILIGNNNNNHDIAYEVNQDAPNNNNDQSNQNNNNIGNNNFLLSENQRFIDEFIVAILGNNTNINRRRRKPFKKFIKRLETITIENISELDDNKRTCIICLEDFINGQKVYNLKCKHIFHMKCLNEWIKRKRTCPLCKRKLIKK